MIKNIWTLVLIALAMVVSGCSANHNTAFRNTRIPAGPSALVVDAKQRMVLSAHALLDAQGNPDPSSVRRFCSEPSPDVFSVIAQALSAGGRFGKTADPASLEIALNAAFSSAEQGATIPRTQTANMLREMMFRTCERYLSGGYDETELSVQAARDQRIMVSILAIEQLTGAVTPKPVIIAASGGGSAGASGDAIIRLDEARKAKENAEGKYASALEAYAEENGEDGVCDAIDGKEEDDLTDEQKAKVEPCQEKRKARDEAKGQLAGKSAAYQELGSLARSGGVAVNTSVLGDSDGGLDRAHADAVKDVAAAVQAIVGQNFSDGTETLLFCQRQIRTLSVVTDITPAQGKVLDRCVEFAISYVEQKEQQLELETNLLRKKLGVPIVYSRDADGGITSNEIEVANALFDVFWAREQVNFSRDATRVALINRIASKLSRPEAALKSCFAAAADAQEMRACFVKLNTATRRILAIGG